MEKVNKTKASAMLWFSLQVAKSKEKRNSGDLAWASFYFYRTAVQVRDLDDLWQIKPKKKRWCGKRHKSNSNVQTIQFPLRRFNL